MQKLLLNMLVGIMIVILPGFGIAEVYQWTDGNGNIHFGDKPGGDNSQKLKYKTKSQQTNSTQKKSAEDITNELRDSRLKREESRKKANQQANLQQCQRRQDELANLRKEVKSLENNYHRFAHSDYKKAQDKKKQIAKLEKYYNRLCK